MRQSSCEDRTGTVSAVAGRPGCHAVRDLGRCGDLDADTTLLVFYDAENKDTVERVVLGQKGG